MLSQILLTPLLIASCSFVVTAQQVDDAKRQIDALVPSCGRAARVSIRIAFHDAGTFDRNNNQDKGGLDGSIQFELDRMENQGLSGIVDSLKSIARNTRVSVADTIAYAGVRAFAVCGGGTLEMKFGRKDATQANPRNRLPNPHINAQDTIAMFVTRMGFTPEETVALIGGGHSTARVQNGFLDRTENLIDNDIFSRILSRRGLIIPSDINMLDSSQLRVIITDLSQNNNKFLQLYRQAFQKMLDLVPAPAPTPTSTPSPTPTSSSRSNNTNLPTPGPNSNDQPFSDSNQTNSTISNSNATDVKRSSKSNGATSMTVTSLLLNLLFVNFFIRF